MEGMDLWHKQTPEQPLFPDLLWSRPENRASAGKLLIIGGNAHGFSVPAEAFAVATATGVGTARVLLPDVLRKSMGGVMAEGEFATSTPSGSFAKSALGVFLAQAAWADGVLLAGDLGRNSETTVLLEAFVQKYTGLLCVTRDAVDYFYGQPKLLFERPDTTIVLSLSQLQKMGSALHFETPFLLSMGLMLLVKALHQLTELYPVTVVVRELDNMVVAQGGQVSTTKTAQALSEKDDLWRVSTAAQTSVWWIQNPSKPFEAMTTALVADPKN